MEHERINFEDHLSFKEIARAWSKVPGDKPEMLMGALVSAFWRGEFESHTQSALFSLGKPPSASFEWSSLCVSITAPFQIVGGGQRRPGDYVISGGAIKKVGEDLESDETAERNLVPTFREHVAYFCRPQGQRGLTPGEPAGFRGWTSDKRDSVRPNWRAEHEEVYRGHSTIPFEQWPTEPIDMQDIFSQWRIRRDDFAGWYRISPLSAGALIETFWPAPIHNAACELRAASNVETTLVLTGPTSSHHEHGGGLKCTDALGGFHAPGPASAGSATRALQPAQYSRRPRGRKPRKIQLAKQAMLKIDSKRLHDMLEKDLVAEFGHIAGRTTLRDARNAVLMGDGAEQCKVESDN